ncbi:MAG: M23 family metallopeptidase [Planctomycetota bacterium]
MILYKEFMRRCVPFLWILMIAAQEPEVLRISVRDMAASKPNISDPAAERIVENGLEAAGGRARLLQIQSIHREGIMRSDGLEGFYGEWSRPPHWKRVELYYPLAGWVTIVNENDVQRRAGASTRALEGAERGEWIRRAAPWPDLYAKEKSVIYSLGPERKVDGKQAQGVFVYFADGSSSLDFYDKITNRLIRREEQPASAGPSSPKLITSFYDYAETAGVYFPRRVKRTFGKRDTEFVYRTVEVGAELPAKIFDIKERRADEPFLLYTIPQKLHREPRDSELKYNKLQFWIAAPTLVLGQTTKLSISLLDRDGIVETREFGYGSLFTMRSDASGCARFPICIETPHDLEFNQIEIVFRESSAPGAREKKLKIPVDRYRVKTELVFPLRMPARTTVAHETTDHHSTERSQSFAYDLAGCDFDGRIFVENTTGERNEDYAGFGFEVIAPAAGKVLFVQNKIQDNPRPGDEGSLQMYMLDELSVLGNCIIIDHQNGEYSLLGHLQFESVRVKPGDTVAPGEVVGLLGNSGRSSAPHLHYHLMDGPIPFECDGLPARFVGIADLQTGRRTPYLRAGETVRPMGATASRPASRPSSRPAESQPSSQPAEK